MSLDNNLNLCGTVQLPLLLVLTAAVKLEYGMPGFFLHSSVKGEPGRVR